MGNYFTNLINNILENNIDKNIINSLNYNRNFDLVGKLLNGGGTYRIYSHLIGDDKWAIISPYWSERTPEENKSKMNELKRDVRNLGYGYTELKSVWSETNIETGDVTHSNEYPLLIYSINKGEAMRLSKKFDQASIIIKEEDSVVEYCTNSFETYDGRSVKEGEVVRTFNIKGKEVLNINLADEVVGGKMTGASSIPTQGNGKPFTFVSENLLESVYEVESPRPSYFRQKEIFIPIYKRI